MAVNARGNDNVRRAVSARSIYQQLNEHAIGADEPVFDVAAGLERLKASQAIAAYDRAAEERIDQLALAETAKADEVQVAHQQAMETDRQRIKVGLTAMAAVMIVVCGLSSILVLQDPSQLAVVALISGTGLGIFGVIAALWITMRSLFMDQPKPTLKTGPSSPPSSQLDDSEPPARHRSVISGGDSNTANISTDRSRRVTIDGVTALARALAVGSMAVPSILNGQAMLFFNIVAAVVAIFGVLSTAAVCTALWTKDRARRSAALVVLTNLLNVVGGVRQER